jgi:hypothetical protein
METREKSQKCEIASDLGSSNIDAEACDFADGTILHSGQQTGAPSSRSPALLIPIKDFVLFLLPTKPNRVYQSSITQEYGHRLFSVL